MVTWLEKNINLTNFHTIWLKKISKVPAQVRVDHNASLTEVNSGLEQLGPGDHRVAQPLEID